ncbi:MAG: DUF1592 domain-containing protein [Planctomycetota bacterium]
MRDLVYSISLLACFAAPVLAVSPQPDNAGSEVIARFLENHCLGCHDDSFSEGDRSFEGFGLPISNHTGLITADEIIDQVTLRQMPPPSDFSEDELPSDAERLELLAALRKAIDQARATFDSTGGRTVLRRLSHREYENTLEALIGNRVDTLGLTADFPKENTAEHLDNVGDALITSGFLLDQYFQAADRLIETRLNPPVSEPQEWHFTDNFVQYEELNGPHRSVLKFKYLCLYEQPNTDTRQGGYGHIQDFLEGVPSSGFYDIKVHVQAMHRDTHYDPEIFRIDFSEPFRIAVVPGDARKGHIHYPQAIEPILAESIVPDDAPEWIPFRVWLDQGQTPRFIFPNGPYESRASIITLNERYEEEFEKPVKGVSRSSLLREGKLPHIRIGEVKIEGPLREEKYSLEELAIFGVDGFQETRALQQLQSFARLAFRRPLHEDDVRRIERVYLHRIDEGATPRQAALDTVKMVLCSPSFLYMGEFTDESSLLLNSHDLASRLSYALWASPPDAELTALADGGIIDNPDVMSRQIERMLDDSRSDRFVVGFLDSWLNLRDLGSQPPSRKDNKDYYGKALPDAMRSEAQLFFRDLLDNDRSLSHLLDSDYTFVNVDLANLYGLPEGKTLRQADGFKRVVFPDRRRRGGVMGMASVLTVSANGVDTSPITRGVWVLENLLGMSPPPPPDEVPSIDANVSGANTIREKLELHRQDETCNVCHRKIDPMGFSLENFDPIGRWRDGYKRSKGAKVDPTGQLPSGERYRDFGEFKKVISETRSDLFRRHLAETLLAYTTGRLVESTDRYAVEDILKRTEASGDGLKTLVREILLSKRFRER